MKKVYVRHAAGVDNEVVLYFAVEGKFVEVRTFATKWDSFRAIYYDNPLPFGISNLPAIEIPEVTAYRFFAFSLLSKDLDTEITNMRESALQLVTSIHLNSAVKVS